MVAVDRGDVVDQDLLGRHVDLVPGHHERADSVDAASGCAGCRPRVEDVDPTRAGERRIVGEAEQPAFTPAAHGELRGRRGKQLAGRGVDEPDPTGVLFEHHDAPTREHFDRRRGRHRSDERVGEPTRRCSLRLRRARNHQSRHRQDHHEEPAHLRTVPSVHAPGRCGRAVALSVARAEQMCRRRCSRRTARCPRAGRRSGWDRRALRRDRRRRSVRVVGRTVRRRCASPG